MGSCNTSNNCNPCGPDFNAINQLATRAGAYARQALTSATNAENSWLEFNALYLGAFASAPTVDNEGNPLQTGALYWNLGSNTMFVWDGTTWVENGNFDEFTNFMLPSATPLAAANLVTGQEYEIAVVGTTNWVAIGAASATVGVRFTKNAVAATGNGTARVTRDLVTRFADVVNVKDYGAVGNGVADDTAAIQAAVNAASSKSKTIFFPAGNYIVSAPINIFSFSCLCGETPQTGASRIRLANGISFIGNANALPHPSFTQLVNVTLENLGFEGTNASVHKQDTSGSLYFVSWIIRGCWFSNSLETTFQSRFVTSEITNCRFGQFGSFAKHPNHAILNLIGTSTPHLTEINALTLSFNRFEQAVSHSVTANFGYAITLLRNTFQANSCPCVFTGVSSIFAANNYWEGNTASSIINLDTATNQAGRVCDIFLHTNHIAQGANVDCIVNVTSNTSVAYASFVNNYIVLNSASGFYLTKSTLGNDTNIKMSLSNYTEFNYIGNNAQAYFNPLAHSNINNEDVTFNLPQNKGIKLTGVGSNARMAIWSVRPDINGLIGGSDFGSIVEGGTNGNLVLGINSNDNTDKLAILSNAGGAPTGTYDTVVATMDRLGNAVIGKTIKWSPASSVNPDTNGQVLIEFTSDTQIKIKGRGSDGIVRSATLTIS